MDCYSEYKISVLGPQTVVLQAVIKYVIVSSLYIEGRVYKVKELEERSSVEEAPLILQY